MTTLTILVPAFNEAATIKDVLTAISLEKIPGVQLEVVVVDDASTDGTGAVLKDCASLYDKLITLPQNRGKGAAVIAGLQAATGDFVLVQDADMEYDPHDYGTLLKPVLDFGAELVIGSRFLAPPWTRVNYFWHKVGNGLITLLFNVLNNTTFTDVYSGFVLFKRSLLQPGELAREGWDQQAEVLSKICGRARVIYEVPISYHGRSYEEGKKIRAQDALPIMWRIVHQRIARMMGLR